MTIIIANSDGGLGYEANRLEVIFGRCQSFDYCLDSYQVMRYLTGKLGFDTDSVLRQTHEENIVLRKR